MNGRTACASRPAFAASSRPSCGWGSSRSDRRTSWPATGRAGSCPRCSATSRRGPAPRPSRRSMSGCASSGTSSNTASSPSSGTARSPRPRAPRPRPSCWRPSTAAWTSCGKASIRAGARPWATWSSTPGGRARPPGLDRRRPVAGGGAPRRGRGGRAPRRARRPGARPRRGARAPRDGARGRGGRARPGRGRPRLPGSAGADSSIIGRARARTAMSVYVARRLAQSLIVLLGISVVVFIILHLTGDPTRPDAAARRIRRGHRALPPRDGLRRSAPGSVLALPPGGAPGRLRRTRSATTSRPWASSSSGCRRRWS